MLDLAIEALEAISPLSEEEIEVRVASRLQERGRRIAGLHERLQVALSSPRFVSSLAGWRLAEHRTKAVVMP